MEKSEGGWQDEEEEDSSDKLLQDLRSPELRKPETYCWNPHPQTEKQTTDQIWLRPHFLLENPVHFMESHDKKRQKPLVRLVDFWNQ